MGVYKLCQRAGRCCWTVFVALILLLAACTSTAGVESPTEPLSTASIANLPTAPATEGPDSQSATGGPVPASPTAGPGEGTTVASASAGSAPELPDDPTELMRATLHGDVAAITEKMAASGNRSFIPVLLEIMRFVPPDNPNLCVVCAINKLLEGPDNVSVPLERQDWAWWIEWLGNHPEVQAPDGFAGWKGEIYSAIDPDFKEFFYDGVSTRVRLEEVVWGGVPKDGIPDLNKPPAIAAAQAAYLQDSDRVFGLSINGEHRAYPLRILNPHEMANDVLGGAPFALAY